MVDHIIHVIGEFGQIVGAYGYIVVFVIALVETTLGIGLFIPGSTILLLTGMSALHGSFSLWLLIVCAALGGITGDNVNYYLGAHHGREWMERKKWKFVTRHFVRGKIFFDTHGAKSVMFGRFIPIIKEIVPFIAGMVYMDKKSFMFYNILGAIGWAIKWIGLGYLFAFSLTEAKKWVLRLDLVIFSLVLGFIGFYLYHKIRRLHKHKTS